MFQSSYSQKLQKWKIQNHTFLDNRENNNKYMHPKTIIGNSLLASAGFSLDSVHLLEIGATVLYEFGSSYRDILINPTIYYSYKKDNISFFFGAFPRKGNIDYPNLLHNDTLSYYRPNIEGASLSYKIKKGFQKVWIDWTGRQSETVRESFMAGTFGIYTFNNVFVENYYYMFHNARTLTSRPIQDNGGGLFLIGLDLAEEYHIKMASGIAFSNNRIRPDPFDVSVGIYNRIEIFYKQYVARMTHYNGKALSLANGDPFYKAGTYMRIDTEANFIKNKNMRLQLQFSMHFTDLQMDSSQKLSFIINLEGDRF